MAGEGLINRMSLSNYEPDKMSSATGDSKCCHLQKSGAPLKMEVGLRAREKGKGKRAVNNLVCFSCC